MRSTYHLILLSLNLFFFFFFFFFLRGQNWSTQKSLSEHGREPTNPTLAWRRGQNRTQATLEKDECSYYYVNPALSFVFICFHFSTQIKVQATRALNSTESDDSPPSSTQVTVTSYLSEEVKPVYRIFTEDQRMW